MTQVPSQPPTIAVPTGLPLKNHRGTLILILGILSFFCCAICGIVAWVLANADLKEMAEGRMDRSGEGLTKAGKIISIISLALGAAFIIIYALLFALGMGGAMMGQHLSHP
jgi:hypothetical protein